MKVAFLQGNQVDCEVFTEPPKETKVQGSTWNLKKIVYGLADTSHAWYLRVKAALINLTFKYLYMMKLFSIGIKTAAKNYNNSS